MKTEHKIYTAILGFLIVGTVFCFLLPKEAKRNEEALIKIGAGDDISGTVMNESLRLMGDGKETIEETTTGNTFVDCCSNSAQWAMNTGDINVAFYCSHIAKHTVENNDNFVIYAPAIMNAEMIAFREEWDQAETLGVLTGRTQEQQIVKKEYPQITDIYEISQKGIGYSLEDGQIDGAVLDITKAALIPQYNFKHLSGQDYISYVLVADREIINTEPFQKFVEAYNQAVSNLKETEYLAECLGVEETWLENTNIKFLKIQESEND